MTDPAIIAAADQYAAASAEARRTLTELALPGTRPRVGVESPPWVARIRDLIMAVDARLGCRHVSGGAHQPINIMAWAPSVSLCSACILEPTVRTAVGLTARVRPPDTCDGCQAGFPDQLTMAVFQPMDVPFLIWCELCEQCIQSADLREAAE